MSLQECLPGVPYSFDPILWGKHAWSEFYYLASTLTDEKEKMSLVQNVQYVVPCDMCTTHYQQKLASEQAEDYVRKNGINGWFNHVRFLIEKELWAMRYKTVSKALLVDEYRQRAERTAKLNATFSAKTEEPDSTRVFLHFLFCSYRPDGVRGTKLKEFVTRYASLLDSLRDRANDLQNDKNWTNRCTLLLWFYGTSDVKTVEKIHDSLTQGHVSKRCNCSSDEKD